MADSAPPKQAQEGTQENKVSIAKLSAQLKRLNDANNKYKNLLKLAKDRIQKQEDEVHALKHEKTELEERLKADEQVAAKQIDLEDTSDASGAVETSIVRVCLRVKCHYGTPAEEIWALMEMGVIDEEGMQNTKQFKEWKKFKGDSDLHDFIRRDTGEPLVLPPYSLSPEESVQIKESADEQVSKVTEEFRRFRVRSELARKQADSQIKDLQNDQKQHVAQQIENGEKRLNQLDVTNNSRSSMTNQVERLQSEMAAQEAHWKEAYDSLLVENNALKSAGSEALLAAQWRQRYENCLKERTELEVKVKASVSSTNLDVDKFEAKYRDLKESFRLYRKKAKEIFEAQQLSDGGGVSSMAAMNITSNSSADAKLSYLKNLMINYLTADPTVRDHMEGAIGTVLHFTSEERRRIEEKKAAADAWF